MTWTLRVKGRRPHATVEHESMHPSADAARSAATRLKRKLTTFSAVIVDPSGRVHQRASYGWNWRLRWEHGALDAKDAAVGRLVRDGGLAVLLDREQLWREYVDLLVAELNEVVGLAQVHGWKSKRYEQGKLLRGALGIKEGE